MEYIELRPTHLCLTTNFTNRLQVSPQVSPRPLHYGGYEGRKSKAGIGQTPSIENQTLDNIVLLVMLELKERHWSNLFI